MASEIEICNAAMTKIGARRVTATFSTLPATEEERLCFEHYDRLRDALLRDNIWNFAKKRASLAKDTVDPLWAWENAFTVPVDLLRLLELEDGHAFEFEGNKIFTDYDAPLNMSYIARIVDPNKFDPLFRDALAARLAYEFAERLKQTDKKKELAFAEFNDFMGRAAQLDALENPATAFLEEPWVVARL